VALLDSEIARIKAELGYNVLSNGAVPWIDIVAIFEQVIQPNLSGGAKTTSSTSITSTGPNTIVIASATGFHSGDRVVIDVDERQEVVTVQNLSGSNLTAILNKEHSGTYPVTVEGPETIVREILADIAATKKKLAEQFGTGALKKVDEVEFYEAGGKTAFGILGENLAYYREMLASALGIQSMWAAKKQGAATVSVY